MIDRQKVATWMLYLVLFLLPWQTRWIFSALTLHGDAWEYGKLSLYATECLLFLSVAIRGWLWPVKGSERVVLEGVGLMGACVLSLAFARDTVLSAALLIHVAAAFVLFASVLDYHVSPRRAMAAFVAGMLAPAALGWFQVLTGMSPASTYFGLASHTAATLGDSVVETATGRVLRAYGSLSHPNTFGGFLVVGMLCAGWLWREAEMRVTTYAAAAAFALFASTLIITFSRSAWLALIAATIVLAALRLWYHKTLPRRALPLLALGLLAAGTTLFVFHNVAFTRFQPAARLEAKSIAERSGEYPWFDDVFFGNPVTGTGVGGYTVALSELRPADPAWSYQPIHNTLLLILAEIGAIGFAVMARWVVSIDMVVHTERRNAVGMFGMAIGTALLVLALLDHYLWTDWSGLALAAFCFAIMVRLNLEIKKAPAAVV